MKSIKSEGLEPKKEKTSIFKTLLALTLIVFAFTTSSSFFHVVNPALAAGALTGVRVIPGSNIVNERATYNFFFTTATTGTIKIIHISFPGGFDVSAATKLIESSGIGSGSLSAPSSTILLYTVKNPVSVPAGTTIRLEIGRIVNSNTAGNFQAAIATENTTPVIIDAGTAPSFPIKDITSSDIATSFMKRVTLFDNTVGHAHGWDPQGNNDIFQITGISDVSASSTILIMGPQCLIQSLSTGQFQIKCTPTPDAGSTLTFTVFNTPVSIVASSLSVSPSSPSSPFATLQVGK